MIEPFVALTYGFIIGAFGGALSAVLGWAKQNEPFETKKFVLGVTTGVIAGIVAVLANTAALTSAADETALLISLATILVGIVGVDSIRTAISGAVANRAVEQVEETK